MAKPFVVVSGLPGSGKSTLARRLAPSLLLPLLDKDDILERLFESKGVGDIEWRRSLSRESDLILQAGALASDGAVLVSHWRLPGMSADAGTPTDWISQLSRRIVHVHCRCSVELAAQRFASRKRHHGHLDHERSPEEILDSIRRTANFGTLEIGSLVEVDVSETPDLGVLASEVRRRSEQHD